VGKIRVSGKDDWKEGPGRGPSRGEAHIPQSQETVGTRTRH